MFKPRRKKDTDHNKEYCTKLTQMTSNNGNTSDLYATSKTLWWKLKSSAKNSDY